MQNHTRNSAVTDTRPDHLTGALKALQGDAAGRLDTLEHPLTRDVSFSTDIYNVALLERFAAHCGVTPGQFAAEVFAAAMEDAAGFFSDKLDTDLSEDAGGFVDAYKLMRFNREKLDAILTGWKSLHTENREEPAVS